MKLKTKAWLYGILSILVVLTLNFLVLYLLDFPLMAVEIIGKYWYLLFLLIGGFGLQISLFTYFNGLDKISCSTTAISGTVSGTSMILCCSHYLLNLLPFLGAFIGISALTKLSDYTLHFLLLGIVSNIFGVGIIYYQRNKFSRRIK